jgi:glucose uptake protein
MRGMFLPHGFATALAMTITSTLCWGSRANTYKLTRGYRFELFYWDYAIGIFAVSLLWALTLGSTGGGGERFVENVAAADGINILLALVGGFIFNVANLLLVAGIDMAGLAIAFPLAIGIALVEGVVLSYALEPRGNPIMLSAGVALAIVAVVFDGRAYKVIAGADSPVSRKSIVTCVVSGLLMGSRSWRAR